MHLVKNCCIYILMAHRIMNIGNFSIIKLCITIILFLVFVAIVTCYSFSAGQFVTDTTEIGNINIFPPDIR